MTATDDNTPGETTDDAEATAATPSGQEAVPSFIRLLDLEPIELDIFRGVGQRGSTTRTFGGLVASQALVAAGRTVPPDRPVHSLHAYFLLPGESSAPTVYVVDRIRDGKSFTTRRVSAIQHGRTIFHLSASFHRVEPGPEHQSATFDAPPPESLPTMVERLAGYEGRFDNYTNRWVRDLPVEVRYVSDPPPLLHLSRRSIPEQLMWFRSREALPDDPLIHVCAATFASDLSLLSTPLLSQDRYREPGAVAMASLDHAMWFHAPFRTDDWLLYAMESPWAGNARGLARGQIFTRDGRLVVSVIQEGMIRPINRSAPRAGE